VICKMSNAFEILKESYPKVPPMWFFENEDVSMSDIVDKLSATSGEDNKVSSFVFQHWFWCLVFIRSLGFIWFNQNGPK
jgi:hypothetical protein